MTTEDRDELVRRINNESTSDEDKKRRIALINQTYENVQNQAADAARQKQQTAEASLKSRLKQSYMSNPAADEAGFEADYPSLRSEYLRNETLRQDAIVRDASARRLREGF